MFVCFSEIVAIKRNLWIEDRPLQLWSQGVISWCISIIFHLKKNNVNEVCYCNRPLLTVKVFSCCLWKFYLQNKTVFKEYCTLRMGFMHHLSFCGSVCLIYQPLQLTLFRMMARLLGLTPIHMTTHGAIKYYTFFIIFLKKREKEIPNM